MQPFPVQLPPNLQQEVPLFGASTQKYATSDDFRNLSQDVEQLILAAKADFARNPLDTGTQQKLKALLDLQTILTSQQLPPDAIKLIKEQVTLLSGGSQNPPTSQSLTQATSSMQPSADPLQYSDFFKPADTNSNPSPYLPLQSVASYNQPQYYLSSSPASASANTSTSLPPNLLAEMLLGKLPNQQSAAGMEPSLPFRQTATPTPPLVSKPNDFSQNTNTLLDSLRAVGLIIPAPPHTTGLPLPTAPAPLPLSSSTMQSSLSRQGFLPNSGNQIVNDVELTTTSIKRYAQRGNRLACTD